MPCLVRMQASFQCFPVNKPTTNNPWKGMSFVKWYSPPKATGKDLAPLTHFITKSLPFWEVIGRALEYLEDFPFWKLLVDRMILTGPVFGYFLRYLFHHPSVKMKSSGSSIRAADMVRVGGWNSNSRMIRHPQWR